MVDAGGVQPCNCSSILSAFASLIEKQRLDLAMALVEYELNSQT